MENPMVSECKWIEKAATTRENGRTAGRMAPVKKSSLTACTMKDPGSRGKEKAWEELSDLTDPFMTASSKKAIERVLAPSSMETVGTTKASGLKTNVMAKE